MGVTYSEDGVILVSLLGPLIFGNLHVKGFVIILDCLRLRVCFFGVQVQGLRRSVGPQGKLGATVYKGFLGNYEDFLSRILAEVLARAAMEHIGARMSFSLTAIG